MSRVERDGQRDDRGVEPGSFQQDGWADGFGGMTTESRSQVQRTPPTRPVLIKEKAGEAWWF